MSLLWAQPSLLRIMPGFTSGSISNEEGSYKIQQLPCGPYTVIAQYLVYQESIQEVLP
jgi:hypothetical protein